ncbi:zinc finger, C2H2 type [Trichuris suis]|nr:zinc finger, C2H2 type [Trichuris suis]
MEASYGRSENADKNISGYVVVPEKSIKREFFQLSSKSSKTAGQACEKTVPCPLHACRKTFPNEKLAQKHVQVHRSRVHVCITCGKAFSSASKLKRHHLVHSREKQFQTLKMGYGTQMLSELFATPEQTHVKVLSLFLLGLLVSLVGSMSANVKALCAGRVVVLLYNRAFPPSSKGSSLSMRNWVHGSLENDFSHRVEKATMREVDKSLYYPEAIFMAQRSCEPSQRNLLV